MLNKTKLEIAEMLLKGSIDKERALLMLRAKCHISRRIKANRTFKVGPRVRNKIRVTLSQQPLVPRIKTQAGFYRHMEFYFGKDEQ